MIVKGDFQPEPKGPSSVHAVAGRFHARRSTTYREVAKNLLRIRQGRGWSLAVLPQQPPETKDIAMLNRFLTFFGIAAIATGLCQAALTAVPTAAASSVDDVFIAAIT